MQSQEFAEVLAVLQVSVLRVQRTVAHYQETNTTINCQLQYCVYV